MNKHEFSILLEQYVQRKYPNIPKNVDTDKVSDLNLTVTQLTGLLQKYSLGTISSDEKKLFNVLKNDLCKDVIDIPESYEELKHYYNEVIRLTELAQTL